MSDAVLVARDAELDGLVTITLNRPEKLNALNIELHDALQPVLTELKTGAASRIVVLLSACRGFSDRADLIDQRFAQPPNYMDPSHRTHLCSGHTLLSVLRNSIRTQQLHARAH